MTDARTVLITGATDGLGRGLAHAVAADGDRVILHGRSRDKLDTLVGEIAGIDGAPEPATVIGDFADLAQVRDVAGQVAAVTDHLDVLVNNAGIGAGEPDGTTRQVSRDGHELRFAVNYLAGFDLTLRTLPLLRAADGARIVNVASIGQSPIDFDDVMLERGYSGQRAYGQSKLAQITAGLVLAERLAGSGITINSLHPATYMPTKIVLDNGLPQIDSLEEGVAATRRLVSDQELAGTTGRFFDRMREARALDEAYDPTVQDRLWRLSLDLTGAPEPG